MYFAFNNPLVFTVIPSASSLSSLLEDSELKTLDSSPGFYVDYTVTVSNSRVALQNEQKQNKGLYSENVEIIHLTILELLLFSSILTIKARKQ